MPRGHTTCKYCGADIPSRNFAKHLLVCYACHGSNLSVSEPLKPLQKKPLTTPSTINITATSDTSHIAMPNILAKSSYNSGFEKPTYTTPLSSYKRKGIDTKNPYAISNRFIKNQIQDGSIALNLSKLIEDGRATIQLNKELITIKINLAKFRTNLNKKFEVFD